MENFNETAYFKADDEDDGPKDPEEAIKEYRDERMREAYSAGEWNQQELANIFDVSRPRVSQIVNADSDD